MNMETEKQKNLDVKIVNGVKKMDVYAKNANKDVKNAIADFLGGKGKIIYIYSQVV